MPERNTSNNTHTHIYIDTSALPILPNSSTLPIEVNAEDERKTLSNALEMQLDVKFDLIMHA